MNLESAYLQDFARRYAAAWCNQNAASVAAFFSPEGSLTINGGTPSVGRSAITQAAQEFMTAFPDMKVLLDNLVIQNDGAVFHWTLLGTNTGPGGTGHRVRVSGLERWQFYGGRPDWPLPRQLQCCRLPASAPTRLFRSPLILIRFCERSGIQTGSAKPS